MKVFCLAAGLGTRLKPYTDLTPKPMIPFLGLPLIYHSLDFMTQHFEIQDILVNFHHHPDKLKNFLIESKSTFKNVNWHLYDESSQLLDSGGALLNAKNQLSSEDNFWVLNADELLLPSLKKDPTLIQMYQSHLKLNALATLLVVENSLVGTQYGGAWANAANDVSLFSKTKPSLPQDLKGWHYVGLALINSKIFNYYSPSLGPSNLLYDGLTAAIKDKQKVSVYPSKVHWYETGVLSEFKKNARTLAHAMTQNTLEGELLKERLSRFSTFKNIIPVE